MNIVDRKRAYFVRIHGKMVKRPFKVFVGGVIFNDVFRRAEHGGKTVDEYPFGVFEFFGRDSGRFDTPHFIKRQGNGPAGGFGFGEELDEKRPRIKII